MLHNIYFSQQYIYRYRQIDKIKSNQITFIVTSPQHKCLGEWNSYERTPDSAEKQQTIYIWTDSAKKTTDNLHMDRQCKKTTDNLHMDRQCKKLHWSIYSAPDSAKKTTTAICIWTDSAKKQQQFTYGQYILQTVQKTMCKIHIHILSTHSVL